ncbi:MULTISPECIES: DUF1439 domain-containing protein [unclassified Lentimonas]|uniref:DUF1439 domain-containing protein n=1 Tax=unclassified Lentimonas TaxID=2630993 RepID=UPI001325EFB2|nr:MULTISPECIES: DUF1439 domain-containing protein [unclassified Lentimonas]CAA6676735.1 Unannotated [Lentimonas sp. CC4]CAA6684600.1 Unannotated [Lentimonas sp. CC6]CAA7075236.1 Unannotated [Lentimonas sp. CC4]CAA7170621.1 Unannotated [Lentimonas sp. CC21]CAA7182356.1 Unannotated [Lentimonas sp. CC8]
MKSKWIVAVLLVSVIFGAGFLYFQGKRYEVVITQSQIDQGLASRFPVSKQYLRIFSITYSNPTVELLEVADRVQVGMDVTLNLRINNEPKELGGGATVTSGIRYEPEAQVFYLDDVVFDRLEVQGLPQKWLKPVTEFASKVAEDFIESQPIYRLEAKDAKTAAAKMLLKGFEVRAQAVHVTLGI